MSRNIVLSSIDTYHSATGNTTQPFTYPAAPRAVQIVGSVQTVYPGAWVDAGYAVIPNVPPGRTLINYSGKSYIETTNDSVDIGADLPGRTDIILAGANTRLQIQLTNLASWDPALDDLRYIVANIGSDYALAGQPAGTTVFDGGYSLAATATSTAIPLINAARGDVLRLAQFRFEAISVPSIDAGVVFCDRPERDLALTTVTYNNGLDNLVFGSMQSTTRTNISVNWRRGDIAALRTSVNPSSTYAGAELRIHELTLNANSGFAVDNLGQGTTRIFRLFGAGNDNVTTTASWAPLHPTFTALGESLMQFNTTHNLIGGGTLSIGGLLYSSNTMPAFFMSPQQQTILPVGNLTIDGSNGFSPVSLTTLTPVVSWNASTGATAYYVTVKRIFNNGTTPSSEDALLILTTETHVTVPIGTLLAGNRYVLTVRALNSASGDPVNAPFRPGGYPYSFAEAVSGTIAAP